MVYFLPNIEMTNQIPKNNKNEFKYLTNACWKGTGFANKKNENTSTILIMSKNANAAVLVRIKLILLITIDSNLRFYYKGKTCFNLFMNRNQIFIIVSHPVRQTISKDLKYMDYLILFIR